MAKEAIGGVSSHERAILEHVHRSYSPLSYTVSSRVTDALCFRKAIDGAEGGLDPYCGFTGSSLAKLRSMQCPPLTA